MSLEDIRSECSDTAALLQPYVDGELGAAEQERVASHLESCRPCRAAVQEQHWVRATLRAVQRDVAPAALRARIGIELDSIDQEPASASTSDASISATTGVPARRGKARSTARPSLWSRAMTTLADVARGGMVMVPASAVAVGLFFVAREGMVPVDPTGTQLGAAMSSPRVQPQVRPGHDGGAPDASAKDPSARTTTAPSDLFVAPPRSPMQGDVQLVHARVAEDDPRRPGASLHYEVFRDGRPTGQRLVDHQVPSGARPSSSGIPVVFGGNRYLLDRTAVGDPVLHFEVGGVAHKVVLEAAMGQSSKVQPDLPDFSFLLDFADRNIKERAPARP